jgi:hypothetical protein
MSYDLAVFDPRTDLRNHGAFMDWYRSRTKWADGLDYHNAANTTSSLRAWFEEMRELFPPMNGPDRPLIEDNQHLDAVTDYSIGKDIIYAAFHTSKAVVAHESAFRLATKHCVGFYDVSGQGDLWFPTPTGVLELIHQNKRRDSTEDSPAGTGETLVDRLLSELQRAKPGPDDT